MTQGKIIEIVLPNNNDFSILKSERQDGKLVHTIEANISESKPPKSFLFQMRIYNKAEANSGEYCSEKTHAGSSGVVTSELWENSIFKGTYQFSKNPNGSPLSSEYIYSKTITASATTYPCLSFELIYNYITTESDEMKIDLKTRFEEMWIKSFADRIQILSS